MVLYFVRPTFQLCNTAAPAAIPSIDSTAILVSHSHGRQPELLKHRLLSRQGCRKVWLERFGRVKTLQREGKSLGAISKVMGLNWRTVAKWAILNELPERRSMNPKSTQPSKYASYLVQRWEEGFRTARHLLPEIQKLGYTGSLTHLERLLSQWRRTAPGPSMQEPSTDSEGHAPPALIVPAIAASFLCMKPRGLLTDQEAEKVMLLKRGNPIFANDATASHAIPWHPARTRPGQTRSLAGPCAPIGHLRFAPIRLYGSQ